MVIACLSLRTLLAVAISSVAVGCGTAPPTYTPLDSAGNSVITVELEKGGVAYYANGDCTDAKIFAPEHNPVLRADRSFVVPSGKRISLVSLWVEGLKSCHVITSMKLLPDTRYLLSGKMEAKVCKLLVKDTRKQDTSVANEIELRQMSWGWDTCHSAVQN